MIGQLLPWLPVSTRPAGMSPVCFPKPARFLTGPAAEMLEKTVGLAVVTLLGILEQGERNAG